MQDYTVDAQVSFSCNEGYELKGFTTLTCQTNGAWSNDVPVCEGIPNSSLL